MLDIFFYRIPFSNPYRTSSLDLTERTGWIFKYQREGITSLAEYAPLPGFGKPDEAGILNFRDPKRLQDFANRSTELLSYPLPDIKEALDREYDSPGLAFALSSLAVQHYVKSSQITDTELLLGSSRVDNSSKLAINDLWSIPSTFPGTEEENMWMHECLTRAVNQDLRDIKLKCDNDLDRLKRVAGFLTHWNRTTGRLNTEFCVKIKADFNRSLSWDDLKSIDEQLSQEEKQVVAYLEDPVDITNLSDLEKLRVSTSIPIGLDETLLSLIDQIPYDELCPILKESKIEVLVVKPPLFGSVFSLVNLWQTFAEDETDLVFSSLLESSVGRAITVRLAELLGSKRHSHGLWTGSLFTQDIGEDPIHRNRSAQDRQNKKESFSKKSFSKEKQHLWVDPSQVYTGHPLLNLVFQAG